MSKSKNTVYRFFFTLLSVAVAATTCSAAHASQGAMNVFRWTTPSIEEDADPIVTSAPLASEPEHHLPNGFLKIDGVSDDFVGEIEDAASTLPQAAVKALCKAGYKIELSRTVPDAVPTSRNQQVRGYEPHSTWNEVFGMFNRTTAKIIMAQYAQLPGDKNSVLSQLDDKQRRRGILRHEFGHALDAYLGNFSHTSAFAQIYKEEKTTVTGAEQKTLAYYLQAGDAGREETFAELFASLDGMGCDRNSDVMLQKRFPRLLKLITTRLSALS